MTLISTDIQKAATILKEGKLVAIPTETVYGLAANIFNEEAVKSIFKLKKRPLFNPLIVHIHSFAQLEELTKEVPEKAKKLATEFWPGPLSLLLQKKGSVPDLITAGKDTVAIRMPNHPLLIELLKKLDFPLAAPSANPFNAISPTTAKRVKDYFDGKLKMVLDGGPSKNGIESTIIGFERDEAIVYRLGAIPLEEIEATIGKVTVNNKKLKKPDAPGMLLKHYSPSTPTILVDHLEDTMHPFKNKKVGFLCFQKKERLPDVDAQEVLSPEGNLEEAAFALYEALHRLDEKKLDLIVIEKFPNEGLGKSINDRLERATAKT